MNKKLLFTTISCLALLGCNLGGGAFIICYFNDQSRAQRSPGNACSTQAIQFFSAANPLVPAELVPDDEQILYFLDYGPKNMISSFSEEELLDIIENNSYSAWRDDFYPQIKNSLALPAFSPDSEAGKQIMSLLFTSTEDYIIMADPVTGEDRYLFGFEYVKFRGSPLIPVPPLLE